MSAIAALRARFQDRRQAAFEAWRRHPRANLLLQRLSLIVDETLQALLRSVPLPQGAALAAVGGYGRAELYPASDVDLLILLADEPDAADAARIRCFVAALWDVGLPASHSVRTPAQCLALAQEDVSVQTALLEARWLAGDQPLFTQLETALREALDPARFFLAKRTEMRRRHAHFDDTPYALEPHCKESPGALRDLHLLLWVSRAAGFGSSWGQIMQAGLLTAAQLRSLTRAQGAFRRLRIELHLLTGRREDRLRFDLQQAVAEVYGFRATRLRRPGEVLMQRYYWAARVVSQLTDMLLLAIEERLFATPGPTLVLDADFCIRHGRLDLRRKDAFARNPSLILRAFLHGQQHAELEGMRATLVQALWHARNAIDAQYRRNPVNRQRFLRILMQPSGAAQALRDMNRLGILPRYLPPFRRIVGLMQHDLFHAYTVDEHTLRVVSLLERVADPRHGHEYPLASALMTRLARPWLLTIAALFHDITKGQPGDHAHSGARLADAFCRAHRLSDEDRALVVFLVREHLTLSRTAQKQDLSDPQVIHAFAAVVGSPLRLRTLYLLTMADIRATSPRVWNAWKHRLLEDLYQKTVIALGHARPDAETVVARRMRAAAQAARALGVDDAQRAQLWCALDAAYFLRHETDDIVWHLEQLAPCVRAPHAVVRARVLGADEALQVLVYTPDRKDLFAAICAWFERETLSIQEARIHTSRDGWALDSFIVLFSRQPPRYDSLTGTVQRALAALLDWGGDGADARPTSARTRPDPSARRQVRSFPLAPAIHLQRSDDGAHWRLSLVCADRPGLLHAIAQVFVSLEIRLKMAKIHTLGERVEDVFFIDGRQLDTPSGRLRLENALLDVVSSS